MSDTIQIIENTPNPKQEKPYARERKRNALKALGWYVAMIALVLVTAFCIVTAMGTGADDPYGLVLYVLAGLSGVGMLSTGMSFLMYLKSSPHLKGGGFPSLANARTNRFTDRCAMLTCG